MPRIYKSSTPTSNKAVFPTKETKTPATPKQDKPKEDTAAKNSENT